jgi:deazaflavin-dependent oxidoreductase (nitroreductase family)
MMDWKSLNRNVIEEFRINSGRVAQFGDLPVVILNTIGAKTGNLLEVPLITVIDDGRMYLFGTNAGAKKQPAWIYNLRANPVIDVEFKTEVFRANLTELDGQQRKDRIQIQSQQTPQFADYIASSAPRQVAVFRIDPL